MEYLKINSLWRRYGWQFDADRKKDPEYKFDRKSFIVSDYAESAFGNIKNWLVDEKIDGTNVRIMRQRPYTGGSHGFIIRCKEDNT